MNLFIVIALFRWARPSNDRAAVEERIPVRYFVPGAFLLWLGEAGNEFLNNLSVARDSRRHGLSSQWRRVANIERRRGE
jgi:hypothetical protein